MATKKTGVKKASAKKTVTATAAPTKKAAGSKLPTTKMTKTQVIRYMAEQMDVPPKQVGGFFSLLIEMATAQTRKVGEFTIPGLGKLVKHSVPLGSDAIRRPARPSRSRPRPR